MLRVLVRKMYFTPEMRDLVERSREGTHKKESLRRRRG